MKHEDIEQHHVIDRYLMGKLPEDQVAAFEEHYLHCRPCQESLALAQHMQGGFKEVASRHLAETQAVRQTAFLAALWRRRGAWGAVMMLALMALPSVWLWQRASDLDHQLETTRTTLAQVDAERRQALLSADAGATSTAPPAAAPDVVPEPTDEPTDATDQLTRRLGEVEDRLRGEQQRAAQLSEALQAARRPSGNTQVRYLGTQRSASASQSHLLELPAQPAWIVLALEIEPRGHSSYRAQLFDADGRNVWQGDSLRLDTQDTVNVSVHSSFLQSGDYRLELEGVSGASAGDFEPLATYTLRVSD